MGSRKIEFIVAFFTKLVYDDGDCKESQLLFMSFFFMRRNDIMRKNSKTTVKAAKETAAKTTAAAKETVEKTAAAAKAAVEKVNEAVAEVVEKAPETAANLVEKAEAVEKVVKKAAPKKTTLKKTVYLQYLGKEIDQQDIEEKVKSIWTATMGKKVSEMKSLTLYLKPEENKAYYVINDEITGSVEI